MTFGDNVKEKIIGIKKVGNFNSLIIDNVLFIDSLKHNFLVLVNYVINIIKLFFKTMHARLLIRIIH